MKRTIPIVPLLLFISTALGADLHVPTPNYPTIQAAIDAGWASVRAIDTNDSLRIYSYETG